jgi:hypothetical protein
MESDEGYIVIIIIAFLSVVIIGIVIYRYFMKDKDIQFMPAEISPNAKQSDKNIKNSRTASIRKRTASIGNGNIFEKANIDINSIWGKPKTKAQLAKERKKLKRKAKKYAKKIKKEKPMEQVPLEKWLSYYNIY